MERRLPLVILLLSFFGFGLSLYSFAHKFSLVSGEFCTLSTAFNCDIVNRGPYSEMYGIPVALIGMFGYLFVAAAAFALKKQPADRGLRLFLLIASASGFLFALYLTSVEAFVLKIWCLVCLTSQVVIFGIFVSAVRLWFADGSKSDITGSPQGTSSVIKPDEA